MTYDNEHFIIQSQHIYYQIYNHPHAQVYVSALFLLGGWGEGNHAKAIFSII
jgi:hypothetical protein